MSFKSAGRVAAFFTALLVGSNQGNTQPRTPLNPEPFSSLKQLCSEISDNVIRRDQLVKKDINSLAVVSVPHVHVFSVDKAPGFKGVIVLTYEQLRADNKPSTDPLILFAPVYIYPEINIPQADLAKLHRDDLVTIIGSIYSYEPHKSTRGAAIRIIGIVVPERR